MGRRAVIISVDTNILLRSAVRDDPAQASIADQILEAATRVIVPSITMCEFAWVLGRLYSFSAQQIAQAIELILEAPNLSTNVPAIEAGLLMLAAGGDFADGVIAFEGGQAGAETFVSFDKKAVRLARAQGFEARLASSFRQ